MGILSGNPKDEPLHYGEVFTLWTNLATNNGLIAAYQTFANHTGDKDLEKILEESIQCMKDENKQIETIVKINGIGLPPAPPERPEARIEDIPPGARFNDPEISAALSMDSAAGLVACSKAMGMSIREDIALMYSQFHMSRAQIGAKLLRLNKDKGWLVPPPLHYSSPEKE
ncbi:DUF3231 family protein [Psychrobacillus lasiicapitis]|uniref:DUF3231 family protein n=1 Tax=Psychrobacillus lasiicapitis TaxID=1636719 RepID=A0A544TH83_9BACI|nr:DUF3231 family protein [Psychrobacillus lasiicapitis]TQR16823.1 DUF3231 family protein [Psychrobacillus lasiicapitis]GGA26860.1 hypothetical protein GCM10011384_15230 [Psychrobacillus lasiicapitis]